MVTEAPCPRNVAEVRYEVSDLRGLTVGYFTAVDFLYMVQAVISEKDKMPIYFNYLFWWHVIC